MATSEQEIVKGIREKITEYEQKITALRQAMNAFQGEGVGRSNLSVIGKRRGRKPGSKNIVKAAASKARTRSRKRKPRTGDTFENTILKLLEDGTPKTTRSLLDLYNKTTGKKLEINGFSARLSIIKKNGRVKTMKNSADKLSYFGKADWFKNGKFKPNYQSKMKSS